MKRIVRFLAHHWLEMIGAGSIVVGVSLALLGWAWGLLLPLAYYALTLLIEWVAYALFHRAPLDLQTPDGSNEPYHPSVRFFSDGWNGYRYWMVYTPMPVASQKKPYIDRWEMPCVCASQDGKHFDYSTGFLDDLTEEEIARKDYFSDGHLVYNEQTDELELFYRLTHRIDTKQGMDEQVLIFRRTSKDGRIWSERETILDTAQDETWQTTGHVVVSPALIREQNRYRMWFVSAYGTERRSVSYAGSDDLKHWDKKTDCTFTGKEVNPWHIDCMIYNGQYSLLVYDFSNELTLWYSKDGKDFYYQKTILRRSPILGQSYHLGLYRACMVQADLFCVYFSLRNRYRYGIGVMMGDTPETLKVQSVGALPMRCFWGDWAERYAYCLQKVCRKLKKR